jgi:hypothetical protein
MKIQSPYTKAIIEYKKAEIVKVFPTLQGRHCDDFVSIHKYLSHVPECFYNEEFFFCLILCYRLQILQKHLCRDMTGILLPQNQNIAYAGWYSFHGAIHN